MTFQNVPFEADIAAASQFLGTEFRAQAPTDPLRKFLKLRELNLQMGTESKTYRIEKRRADGTVFGLIQQSTDSMGVPAANTAESVILKGADIEVTLAPGEQIQIVTAGATAAMRCKIIYEEVDP